MAKKKKKSAKALAAQWDWEDPATGEDVRTNQQGSSNSQQPVTEDTAATRAHSNGSAIPENVDAFEKDSTDAGGINDNNELNQIPAHVTIKQIVLETPTSISKDRLGDQGNQQDNRRRPSPDEERETSSSDETQAKDGKESLSSKMLEAEQEQNKFSTKNFLTESERYHARISTASEESDVVLSSPVGADIKIPTERSIRRRTNKRGAEHDLPREKTQIKAKPTSAAFGFRRSSISDVTTSDEDGNTGKDHHVRTRQNRRSYPQRQLVGHSNISTQHYDTAPNLASYSNYYPAPFSQYSGAYQSHYQFTPSGYGSRAISAPNHGVPYGSAVAPYASPPPLSIDNPAKLQHVTRNPGHEFYQQKTRTVASAPVLPPTTSAHNPLDTSVDGYTESKVRLNQSAEPLAYPDASSERGLVSKPLVANHVAEPSTDRAGQVPNERLVFAVPIQCSHATLHSRFSTLLHQYWPERAAESDLGVAFVRKVVSSKRFKKRDGSVSVELSCHEGPALTTLSHDYHIQWLHMQRHSMDLGDFEDMCLNAPNITGELKYVVLRLFKQVRDTSRKRFHDGFSMDPGTVLRCDGTTSRHTNIHDMSATFICFPFMSLGERKHHTYEESDYPIRSMLQTLYPYESVFSREMPPSFCKGAQNQSNHILYVPQIWIVIIGSKYVVTCAKIGSDEIVGDSITTVQANDSIAHLPQIADTWLPQSYRSIETARDTAVDKSTGSAVNVGLRRSATFESSHSHATNRQSDIATVQLFDGLRVEEYIVDDDDDHYNAEIQLFDGRRVEEYLVNGDESLDENDSTRPTTAHGYPAMVARTEKTDTGGNPPPSTSAGFSTVPVESKLSVVCSTEHNLISPEAIEENESLLSVLSSLKQPRMDAKYLEAFETSISYLLHICRKKAAEPTSQESELMYRLEQSLPRANMLRSTLDLQLNDTALGIRPPPGQVFTKEPIRNVFPYSSELRGLAEAVQDAVSLLQGNPNLSEEVAIENPPSDHLNRSTHDRSSIAQRSDPIWSTQKLVRRDTPPFLTWAWLSSDLEKSIPAPRLAAETLFTIMQDIDRNLRGRSDVSYINITETTLAELEASISVVNTLPFFQPHHISSPAVFGSISNPQSPSSPDGPPPPPSPLRQPLDHLVSGDIILDSQREAVHGAINDLSSIVKDFVGLFIPHSYHHPVSNRIWGALRDLLQSIFDPTDRQDERARHNYLVRPQKNDFMERLNMETPKVPFDSCLECAQGHVYKSIPEAVSHLKRVHFRDHYDTRLQQLAHLQSTHQHWIRSEEQVRNELSNNQQLHLLRICLNYIKILSTRAEKIHQGIAHEGQDESAKYQLPDDLVECFEATALFIMQSAASLTVIKQEMRRWQHIPGGSLEKVDTPTIQDAVGRLGNLGQAAQAAMTRAEKTLALSDPETNMLSMGAAGPELLVSVLLHNVQKFQLLQDVDMDVNQLYQEATSKLQYQINQFPRKRLLRDIQNLQEQLSVVQSVNLWQQQGFDNFLKVLNPLSFERPTETRVSMFSSEAECLRSGITTLHSKGTELNALIDRTQYLREQLKQSVEILEEDHGKAILVFTMITTIFLPLSFISSFFGMNTADIRNTDRSQGFFWAIAVPITAVIVFAAVLLAYHGDKLYDEVIRTVHEFTKKHMNYSKLQSGSLTERRPSSWSQAVSMRPRFQALRRRTVFRRNEKTFEDRALW